MSQYEGMTRRGALGALAGAAGILAAGTAQAQDAAPAPALKGRLKQSVSRWCYGKVPSGEFYAACKAMGLQGVDLLDPKDWDEVKSAGLISTMNNGPGGIAKGWCNPDNHAELIEKGLARMREVKQAGWDNMILLAGNRRSINDEDGLTNSAKGIEKLLPLAEELGVNLVLELLNSKRDHKDYMADHTAWGVKLAKQLGSKRFSLLYDIYHMQIMEGDVIATIQENYEYIGHYHTGGVPGRHEIDAAQELNYRRICEVIVETGFTGFLAHEFVPTRDPLTSLKEAVAICDV